VCELRNVDLFEMVDGVSIWGLAPVGPYAYEAFIDCEDLSFPLSRDTAQRVAETYDGLWTGKDGFERVPERALFLVDSDPTVRYRWVAEDNWELWTNERFREMEATIS